MSGIFDTVEKARKMAPVGSRWKHYKGGIYIVVSHGILEREWEACVSYMSVTGGEIIHRSATEFADGRFQRTEV